jgi:hypothetical protein
MMTLSYDAYAAAEQAFDAAVDRFGESPMVTADIIANTLNEHFIAEGLEVEAQTLQGDGIVCVIIADKRWNRGSEDFRYMTPVEWAMAYAALEEAAQ